MTVHGTTPLTSNTVLALTIGEGAEAIAGDALKVYCVSGHEALSQPFRYAVDLVHVDADNKPRELHPDDVLDRPATLNIAVDDGGSTMQRNVHGVVEELVADEYLPPSGAGTDTLTRYRLLLVPRLAMLARNRQNRIHATSAPQKLEELISNKLLSRGPDHSSEDSGNRIALEEDEFRIDIDNDRLPLQELSHVALYNETDLDFVRRVCEHHGVYFFFASNPTDSSGMVVFGNTNTPFGVIRFESDPHHTTPDPDDDLAPPTSYPEKHKLEIELTLTGTTGLVDGSQYTEPTDDAGARLEGVMFSFQSVHRPVPRHVRVIDDNGSGRGPDLNQSVDLNPGGDGIYSHGVYTDYDTRFSSATEGIAFANIRSQELEAASNYHLALTNSPCVAPGRTFRKASGPDTYRHFLVTEVDVEIRQAHPGLVTEIDGLSITTGFTNRFRCIDFDATAVSVFRPPRITPVPRLPGVHTAYIATGTNGRPVLDAQGAYRVYHKHAEERTEPSIDNRSMPVRKAEPYAGDGVGMHFPLKKDTEVLLAYRNGDPDRPVIAAAMPGDGEHLSPVTDANPTAHVIETSSGARFEIHDDYRDDRARVALRSRQDSDLASYLRLGNAHLTDTDSNSDTSTLEDHYAEGVYSTEPDKHDGIALFSADAIREATKSDKITEAQQSVRVRAGEDIHALSVQNHLLSGRRIVIHSGPEEEQPTAETNAGTEATPFTVDDDDTFIHASGNIYLKARHDIHVTALGASTTETTDVTTQVYRSDLHTHVYADEHKRVAGSFNMLVLGALSGLTIGARTYATLGNDTTLVGPVVGYFGFGVGLYVWPQVALFHGVVLNDTVDAVRYFHCPSEKKTSAMSLKHHLTELCQTQLGAHLENTVTRIVSMFTIL